MGQAAQAAAIMPRAASRRAGRRHPGDLVFAALATASGLLVLGLMGAIIVMLFVGGWQAFSVFGVGFLWSDVWDPVRGQYGALVPVVGTLLTSALALAMAVPVAFGVAFCLTELAPAWFRRPVGIAIELLAAIPSIIFGMWGFFELAPILGQDIMPALQDATLGWPVFGTLFGGPTYGIGVLTAGIILAIMVLPFIAATMRDVFLQVPAIYKESAYGLGATTWEVMRRVVIPYTRSAVAGGIMLGLGRALGETMAVTFVIGNANRLSASLFAPGNTIASLVALEFAEAEEGSLKLSALLAIGFILFVISFIVLAASRFMLRARLKG
ncbi:MAG: phosphate ABC transporter permease subunit PstC [Acetobacteraceae bacterium]|nr:phosphate ABC transporter permease subunit PstC [Acetobacteraceae bacterium]